MVDRSHTICHIIVDVIVPDRNRCAFLREHSIAVAGKLKILNSHPLRTCHPGFGKSAADRVVSILVAAQRDTILNDADSLIAETDDENSRFATMLNRVDNVLNTGIGLVALYCLDALAIIARESGGSGYETARQGCG
jgi:hypothetical protein